MPWKKKRPMCEHAAFVKAREDGIETMAALCRAYGISRKTGYKRLRRSRATRCRHVPNAIRSSQIFFGAERPNWALHRGNGATRLSLILLHCCPK